MRKGPGGKWLKWLIIVALVGAAAYFGWEYWNKPKNAGPLYRTAQVTRGDVIQAVTATGQLNPVANVQVGSQISGMIQKLFADFNSSVTQGQVIAELDSATYRAAVHQAEADLSNSVAALELSQVEARRAEELKKNALIAEADFDKAVADLHQAEAQRQMRLALLERARVDLSRCTILAPTNGTVISRNVDVGQTVAASLSAPTLFVIANDLRKMQIDAMVSEADIGGVEEGQTVSFSVDAFPARMFEGKVIQIRNAPTTNQNVVTYDTVIEVDNADLKLKPGMTANVSIILAEHAEVLKMPNAALRFRPADATEPKRGGSRGPGGSGGGERRGQMSAASGPGVGGSSGFGSNAARPGRGGSGESGAGRRQRREDRALMRTVYTLSSTNAPPEEKPQPHQVKLGISDGAFSEVVEGLKENDIVVVGSNVSDAPRSGAPTNPFGGGRRF